jgi:hypothetical protein
MSLPKHEDDMMDNAGKAQQAASGAAGLADLESVPTPGSQAMPPWTRNELVEAPVFTRRNWFAMLGPGLVMGASAVGGGEWLAGPAVTAKYGPALLWVATVSILVQVLYNIEISRYTLYSGEPIFTGKFRTLPGPMFWLVCYMLLDWGSVFPYLVVNAAVALESMFIENFDPVEEHFWLHKFVSTGLFLSLATPLIVGGKIYNSLRIVMTFKLITVFGFLLIVGLFFSRPMYWGEIVISFFKFGTVPVERSEDRNGNGVLDPGEDFDRDGHLDVVEPKVPPSVDSNGDGVLDDWQRDSQGQPIKFLDLDGDGKRDGPNVDNAVLTRVQTGSWPTIDWSLIAFIAGLAAIAGNGGLTNTPISNFTRDQGWGMGYHVGAIPSIIGGHGIELSHVGSVFEVNDKSLPRWRRWYRHVARDQTCVWMTACFIGVGLPAILSVGFLPRGTEADRAKVAAMTSDGVGRQVANPPSGVLASTPVFSWMSGPKAGAAFRIGTLFCGFLVLATSMLSTIDGFVRRWVDVIWTASAKLRELPTSAIRYVYFSVLVGYITFGTIVIWLTDKPGKVFELATTGYNFAFAFSCWHALAINSILLPRELRPHVLLRLGMLIGGCYFVFLGVMAVLGQLGLV